MTDNHVVVTPGRDMRERSAHAVANPTLQSAMRNLDRRLHTAAEVEAAHGDWKDRAAAIRRETLADLDGWLARLERSLIALGVQVHRAATAADARAIVLDIARAHDSRRVVKSKSMATEEIDLGAALEADGRQVVETDLGEYIVQLAHERPSHMITPAIHKTLAQISAILSEEAGVALPVEREELTAWARARLRAEFLAGDLGVTGVNLAAADTGTVVLVTNEGNGRFCTAWPRVHVALMPVEKVVPRFADLGVLVPLLTASATGQPLSNYVQMITGPRRDGELDGPDEMHVVFLDNHRLALRGTAYEEMLACIRCGACLNVCPVYRRVSGHAYDSVYSGPMGKVLTPLLSAGAEGRDLPHGSTLCGACTEACPVEIPLADMIVRLRADLREPGPFAPRRQAARTAVMPQHARRPGEGAPWPANAVPIPARASRRWTRRRLGFSAWARAWSSPAGYRATAAVARACGRLLGRNGWARRVPLLGSWTRTRDLPLPAREPFHARWKRERGGK